MLTHKWRPLMSGVVQARCIINPYMIHDGIHEGLVRNELVFLNELLLIVRLIY